MTQSPNDPRVYFSAERTLLAWARTALSVMGFGFVVARFGLYLRMLTQQPAQAVHHTISTGIGVALVIVATVAIAIAAWQYRVFIKTLPNEDRPQRYWLGFAFWYAVALAFIGLLLSIFLVVSMNDA